MASKFETGHFVNLNHFNALLQYLATLPQYAPDVEDLQLAPLQSFRDQMTTTMNQLYEESATLQQMVNNRVQYYDQTNKMAARIMRYLEANATDEAAIADVRAHYNSMKSKKLSRKETVGEDGNINVKTYSSNRLSFVSKAEHFQKMVERMATMSGFNPTDAAITLNNLKTRYQDLNSINSDINAQVQKVNNIRNERDQLMYQKTTGLVDRAARIKKYIQYKYGHQSDQEKALKSFKFKKKQVRLKQDITE